MSRCAIYCLDDRGFFCGLASGWSKQLRLALVYSDGKTAMRTIREWREMHSSGGPTYRLVWIHWRIRNTDGERVTDRGSIAECRDMISKYADPGTFPGWSHGPYKIMRVASVPRARPQTSPPQEKGNGE